MALLLGINAGLLLVLILNIESIKNKLDEMEYQVNMIKFYTEVILDDLADPDDLLPRVDEV